MEKTGCCRNLRIFKDIPKQIQIPYKNRSTNVRSLSYLLLCYLHGESTQLRVTVYKGGCIRYSIILNIITYTTALNSSDFKQAV